jgi:hypothetical protein
MLGAFHVSGEVRHVLVSQSLTLRQLLLRVEIVLEDLMIRR